MISGTIFIGAVIVGITEFAKRLHDKDTRGALMIVLAAVVGGLVAAAHAQLGIMPLTVAQGILIGLAAAGAYKVTTNIG